MLHCLDLIICIAHIHLLITGLWLWGGFEGVRWGASHRHKEEMRPLITIYNKNVSILASGQYTHSETNPNGVLQQGFRRNRPVLKTHRDKFLSGWCTSSTVLLTSHKHWSIDSITKVVSKHIGASFVRVTYSAFHTTDKSQALVDRQHDKNSQAPVDRQYHKSCANIECGDGESNRTIISLKF